MKTSGLRRDDGVDRGLVPREVAGEHLDGGVRHGLAQRGDDGDEVRRTPVGQVVARHGRHDDVREPHPLRRFGHAARLVRIERFRRARVDGAEAAASRAGVAHDQERRGPGREALTLVRALRGLAHRVEAQVAESGAHLCLTAGRRDGRFSHSGMRLAVSGPCS